MSMKTAAIVAFVSMLMGLGAGCTETQASHQRLEAGLEVLPMEETSLVTLIFPRVDGLKKVSVEDHVRRIPIPGDHVVALWNGKTVVTLKLPRGKVANLHLKFDEALDYKARFKPGFSMSMFDNLKFGETVEVLRDHGSERTLKFGEEMTILPEEVIKLWVSGEIVEGARVNYRNSGDVRDLQLKTNGCEVATVKKGTELTTTFHNLTLSGDESITIVATPSPDAGVSTLSVVAH